MLRFTNNEGIDIPDFMNVVHSEPKTTVSEVQKEKLIEFVSGLNETEMKIVLDNIPIDLLLDKIKFEIEKNRKYISAIQEASSIFSN